uniref:Uncharacterized protein n=1 Tax=Lygus hesperus TaxID=30085 RepID=A0A0A9XFY5_LYGHE
MVQHSPNAIAVQARILRETDATYLPIFYLQVQQYNLALQLILQQIMASPPSLQMQILHDTVNTLTLEKQLLWLVPLLHSQIRLLTHTNLLALHPQTSIYLLLQHLLLTQRPVDRIWEIVPTEGVQPKMLWYARMGVFVQNQAWDDMYNLFISSDPNLDRNISIAKLTTTPAIPSRPAGVRKLTAHNSTGVSVCPMDTVAIIEMCVGRNAPHEAARYVIHLREPIEKISWFCRIQYFNEAASIAFQEGNRDALLTVRARAVRHVDTSTLQRIDAYIRQLS